MVELSLYLTPGTILASGANAAVVPILQMGKLRHRVVAESEFEIAIGPLAFAHSCTLPPSLTGYI